MCIYIYICVCVCVFVYIYICIPPPMVLYVPTFPLQTSTWGAICSSCYCVVICSIWLPFAAFGSHLHAICSMLGAAAAFAAFPTHSLPVRPTTYTLNQSTSLLPTKLPLFYRSLCSDFVYMTTYYLCTTTYRLLTAYILHIIYIPVVPHKAVAEVAKIGNLLSERLAVVNHGWQSESTDGPTGGWGCVFFELLRWLQWSPYRNCWM